MEVKNDGVENACLSEDNLHDPIAVYLACTSSGYYHFYNARD